MCGITGIRSFRSQHVDESQLRVSVGQLAHRGPDELGVYVEPGIGLAHARLSIIDLSGGHQPMSTEDGSLWIVFNGEIFNYIELREELISNGHRFRTASDTEVILHLYQQEGERCVQRMNGQWAFAIWDRTQQKLFLSRDRFGVRPLFYTQSPDRFLFASEIKGLFCWPGVSRELDLVALDEIFTFWVTSQGRTAFRKVRQVPPGHSMIITPGETRLYPYWQLTYSPEPRVDNFREKQLTEELLALLWDAVRIRLRSDVPVGAYLSGGLDSSIIVALVKKIAGDQLRTFSIAFRDSEFDESRYQNEATEYLHTKHSVVHCTADDIAQSFPDVIWHAEQPMLRTAPAPMLLLSKFVCENGFKVVITGEGADEIFGGYDIFKEAKIRRFWGKRIDSKWRPHLLKRLYPYLDGLQHQSTAYLRSFFHVSAEDLAHPFFSHVPRWALTSRMKEHFSAEVRATIDGIDATASLASQMPEDFAYWDGFNQAEYLEALYLLPGYILSSQGDRMAMANSIEGRYPFLDFRVVEFASALPPRLKMKVLSQKYLLKKAAANLIPASILDRHKQPYRAPDGKSFLSSKQDYVEELLSPDQIRRDGIFRPETVTALRSKFKSGRAIGMKDNMAFVGVLSTQLLLAQFVNNFERLKQCNPPLLETYTVLS